MKSINYLKNLTLNTFHKIAVCASVEGQSSDNRGGFLLLSWVPSQSACYHIFKFCGLQTGPKNTLNTLVNLNHIRSITGLFSGHEAKIQVNGLHLFPSKQTNKQTIHKNYTLMQLTIPNIAVIPCYQQGSSCSTKMETYRLAARLQRRNYWSNQGHD